MAADDKELIGLLRKCEVLAESPLDSAKASRGVRELGKDIRELAGLLQGGEAVDSPQEPPTSPGGDPNSAQRRTGHDDEQTATKP
jgi:hypothetical protein